MATIKIKYLPFADDSAKGRICYEVRHEMTSHLIHTCFVLNSSEWDPLISAVGTSADTDRAAELSEIRRLVYCAERRLMRIIAGLDRSGIHYDASLVAAEYHRHCEMFSLPNYMNSHIARLRSVGRIRTSETYKAALSSFMKFMEAEGSAPDMDPCQFAPELMIDSLTPDMFENYEAWHRRRGSVPNTISFYMRILRAVYNRAVDEGITEDLHPFRHVYTGIDKTLKRAIPLNSLREIIRLDLSRLPSLEYARDMFLMSFYLRGMSFIDMAFLKKADLNDGQLCYRRRKTGQLMTIRWTAEMQKIIDKYPALDTPYLLPILPSHCADEMCSYRSRSSTINRNLKKVARLAGINIRLTLYTARHSWATAARSSGIPLSVISQGMGHDSELTTRIYLASLETSVVDNANSRIISALVE